ncbi:phosphate ABC transporter membrane protein 1, PhoT family [Kytococcus aerolatus]|uniref:Phosphate transport system permease protein n=1 Tax=Kytococcus aerolatus TaxID=592308 RepID=A0A212U8E3_9MICO|nr:phosphate ABC transporter permease subunit PstC [Kytococcus aerolatus]SNC74314.1 phosphate ABC transporter membrane protein 1, PhoT family [Kytococcus aerolatus]
MADAQPPSADGATVLSEGPGEPRGAAPAAPVKGASTGRLGDKIFSGLSVGSGIAIAVILALVALFLIREAWPIFQEPEAAGSDGFWQLALHLLGGTLLASAFAMLIAVPVAVGIALFISHYAPPKIAKSLGFVIDLLAAIPSVIFGLWGYMTFAPKLVPLYEWLEENLGFIPLFEDASTTGRVLLTASIVLAIMILPIITSVARDVFQQVPRGHEEASLALGATKWEMIKQAVLPFGWPGVIGGAMLGLGRALGETMAVAMILAPRDEFQWNVIGSGNFPIPAYIALNFPDATGLKVSTLIALGLVLFVLTLVVNLFARWIVERRN